MTLAFLFAGQGSQSPGMGADLYEAYASARAVYDRAASAVDFDLKRVSFEGPEEELQRTDVSQPAIVVHSLAALRALEEELGGSLPEVAYTAGLSLGEYSALCFAESVSLEDTLRLVIERGRYMQACCEAEPSGMISLLGAGAADLEPALEAGRSEGIVGIANDNAPKQVVISGAQAAVEKAAAEAKGLGVKRAVPLKVAGAYHSQLMAPAGEKLKGVLAEVTFGAPTLPVVANVSGVEHEAGGDVIKAALVAQVSAPVRFRESLARMFGAGVDRCVEFGPGGVLKGIVRQNDRGVTCHSVATVEDVKALAQELQG